MLVMNIESTDMASLRCSHCKALDSEFKLAATQLQASAFLAKVDATSEEALSDRFGISAYPTIKVSNSISFILN